MRVLVTRSPDDAERTARKLAARGYEAILSPVTRIVPTAEAPPAGPYDALVVTSAHAADAASSLPGGPRPVFAVGERTADALRAVGFSHVMTAQGDAQSLSGLIRRSLDHTRVLLHVTGRHHKDEPAASLRAAGFAVLTWEAYEAQAAECLPSRGFQALRAGQIQAALHYSRRSADLFIRLAEGAGLSPALREFPHLCLSADVAAPLEAAGVSTLVAADLSEDALLALLDGLPRPPRLRS
jgi:uroporphyrinogen-III synthase